MITPNDFRDHYVSEVSIRYESEASQANVRLAVVNALGVSSDYEIAGGSAFSLSEDFRALAIDTCTLINEPGNVYLSLDPFNEGTPSDRDNFFFKGLSIGRRHGS